MTTLSEQRPLHFNAFVFNSVSHVHHGQWRRPEARQTEFQDLKLWIDLARTLEEAKFDAVFFADVVGHYGDADADFDVYAREGLQLPNNDPLVLLGAIAAVTEHLGLAATSNVFQSHPFQFARQISTLDHLSQGRAAWNIVTGSLENGSRNFGLPRLTDHAERYRWAEEYLEVVFKLWEGSWEDDAVLKDKERGVYSDPAKIHKIHHRSERYSVEGPHLSAPSPQRTPVLFQAGSSLSGRRFAAGNAEATFIASPSVELARQQIAETRRFAAVADRDPSDIKFFQGLSFVVGGTELEAHEKAEDLERTASLDGYTAHSALLDENGRVYPPDVPLDAVHTNTAKGGVEWLSKHITDRVPVVGDLALSRLRRGRIVGTADQIADQLQTWRDAGVDGVNVTNWVIPGSFEEFAEHVLPVLRERGLAQEDYAPGPLRQKLFGGSPRVNDRHPASRFRASLLHSA